MHQMGDVGDHLHNRRLSREFDNGQGEFDSDDNTPLIDDEDDPGCMSLATGAWIVGALVVLAGMAIAFL